MRGFLSRTERNAQGSEGRTGMFSLLLQANREAMRLTAKTAFRTPLRHRLPLFKYEPLKPFKPFKPFKPLKPLLPALNLLLVILGSSWLNQKLKLKTKPNLSTLFN
jgi:hypothetical protein